MRTSTLLILLLLWKQDSVSSVRLIELRVPAHAAAGGEALLGCQFDMEGDVLYSVKWYKDDREFYRYVPKNRNPALHFATNGVFVDETRSSSDAVTLVNLNHDSTGVYRCEVSGEAPLFATAAEEKYVSIHFLPESAPQVTGLRNQYQYGDRVVVNCSTAPSKPEAQLKWLINNKLAPRAYLRGPWIRVSEDPPDTVETTLQLTFIATPLHFKDGLMELKCRATIPPLYQQETMHTIPNMVDIIGEESREVSHHEAFDKPESSSSLADKGNAQISVAQTLEGSLIILLLLLML